VYMTPNIRSTLTLNIGIAKDPKCSVCGRKIRNNEDFGITYTEPWVFWHWKCKEERDDPKTLR